MRVNVRFQVQHLEAASADWIQLQKVERDICLLYHQLADYSYIMSDLYYGSVFSEPYWHYLDVQALEPDEQAFLRDGCLVMILAMATELTDGSGAYLLPHMSECRAAVDRVTATDERTNKLLHTVRLALALADDGQQETRELVELSQWVHGEYVQGYFRSHVHEFDHNPYFGHTPLPDHAGEE